jgi:hypothetical protein
MSKTLESIEALERIEALEGIEALKTSRFLEISKSLGGPKSLGDQSWSPRALQPSLSKGGATCVLKRNEGVGEHVRTEISPENCQGQLPRQTPGNCGVIPRNERRALELFCLTEHWPGRLA